MEEEKREERGWKERGREGNGKIGKKMEEGEECERHYVYSLVLRPSLSIFAFCK